MKVKMPKGRNTLINYNSLTIMDETYNASPESVQASLELLIRKPGRHYVVLGTMLELGSESLSIHLEIIEKALSFGINGIVIVAKGEDGERIKRAFNSISRIVVVPSPEDAISPLSSWLEFGDTLLLKASRGIQLEKLLPQD